MRPIDGLSESTPLDAALDLGVPDAAEAFDLVTRTPTWSAGAPLITAAPEPRSDVTDWPPSAAPARRRLAPWVAIAAIVGIGVGLAGRGALTRGPAATPAVAAPPAVVAPPAARPAPAREDTRGDGPVEIDEEEDRHAAIAGQPSLAAVARPAAAWRPAGAENAPATGVPGIAGASPGPADTADAPDASDTTAGTSPTDAPPGDAAPGDGAPTDAAPTDAPVEGTTAQAAGITEPGGDATDGIDGGATAAASTLPFDRGAASVALTGAAAAASRCRSGDDPSGSARVAVTFAPSGRVTQATVSGPPFAGTATGGCIASAFRGVTISPFQGGPVTVTKSVSIR